mmetsp:Transcript_652/g.1063  ORF Transcript_652/g.1063 Transcript_652/m.1063 type:complete len:712 (+) Transcript_652:88-2223(+)
MEDDFLSVTGETNASVARQYLEMSGNNLELAVSLFLDHSSARDAEVMSSSAPAGGGEETSAATVFNNSDCQIRTEVGEAMAENDILDDLSSEPDYDYLAEENMYLEEQTSNIYNDENGENDSMPSTPDYDNLGADCEDKREQQQYHNDLLAAQTISMSAFPAIPTVNDFDNIGSQEYQGDCYEIGKEEFGGDEYILGNLMIRVLQARNLRPNPNNQGGIGTLLSNHRRARHQRSTMSPASGGNITPLSSSLHPYAKLSFRGNTQITSTALEHAHGDYHWSRGDQSYFDVTCSSFPLRMGKMHQSRSYQSFKSKSSSQQSSPKKETVPKKGAHQTRSAPPMLQLSLFSKSSSALKHKKQIDSAKNNDDYLIGKCNINILRILTGKTPYFDEWCILHNDNVSAGNQTNEAGRVRIVIEYEPTDPPPRPGDLCVFANVYPIDEELYPVPLYTVKNATRPLRPSVSTSSFTTLSSTSLSSYNSRSATLMLNPKSFRVDEVVGDYVVLTYKTPEGWNCTFEVHRYLLLCIERYQAVVEKCKDQVLDLCDNLSQSPMIDIIGKKIEALPDEGLVFVGSEAVGSSVHMLGRWLANGVDVAVEDVVNGFNLDGRYSHPEEDEETSVQFNDEDGAIAVPQQPNSVEEKTALPGMPSCPITGVPMVDPVVAADGHTYERLAIVRWMQTSTKSPLTGEVLGHSQLVSNYMLIGLSSLGKRTE